MSGELHHRLDGPDDAPVLVLSNSLGTSLEMWDGMLPALAGHFRVLRYDQRGHGATPATPGPYSIEDLGRDVLGLLDVLGLERVSFAGCSLGGMTGMWLAINAPGRVGRLALCNTSAHMPPRETWTERAATVRERGMGAVVDAALERWFSPEAPARERGGHARDAARHRRGGLRRLLRGDRGARPARGDRADTVAHRDRGREPTTRPPLPTMRGRWRPASRERASWCWRVPATSRAWSGRTRWLASWWRT